MALISDTQNQTSPIRKVDVEKDLGQIADLIEICFGEQMDEDGHEYIRQIRRAARDIRQVIWVRGSNEWVAMPMHGYVCLEGQQIIGNVTLVPFQKSGKWVYLICNVAVHPEFRRWGLSKKLLALGLKVAIQLGAIESTLEVRESNLAAQKLYEKFGFREVGRRLHYYRDNNEDAVLMTVKDLGTAYLSWLETVIADQVKIEVASKGII